jgi:hypothetical protein
MRVKMTDRWCEAAQPAGAARVDFFDEVVGGLALRCSGSRKAWSLVFTSPGDGKRARVGRRGHLLQRFSRFAAAGLAARETIFFEGWIVALPRRVGGLIAWGLLHSNRCAAPR